jgi:two-component system, chemotaxis family, sensor kinase CheA
MDLAGGITQDDLKLFLQEADEQIELLDEDIVRLEKEAANPDLMQEIFRAAHTLKGSSAMVGHQRMSDLAHAMENVLDNLRKGMLAVTPIVVDALLHGLDVMRVLRQELVTPDAKPTDITEATNELAAAIKTPGQVVSQVAARADIMAIDGEAGDTVAKARQEGKKVFRVRVTLDKQSSWASVRCFQIVQELSNIVNIILSQPSQQDIEDGKAGFTLQLVVAGNRSEGEIKKSLGAMTDIESIEISECGTEPPAAAPVKAPGADAVAVVKDESKQTVRVDVGRLDTLMEQVGELVINRNQVSQIGRLLGDKYRDDELVNNLGDCVAQIAKIVSTLQQDVMSIRLLPIEIVFNTLPRMVRDTARKMNKKIDFIIEGQETEVDRSVIEHLRDPLMHLLRNSVDHGIESPEERLAAGKPEVGTVRLSAYHEEDTIIIKLQDDGKGISPDKLRETAARKNIMSLEAASKLTDAEAINLIFGSGFSTAQKVTEVSGRGVGLDVVKTNIEILSGSVNVESVEGRGTTFTLMLPLTLAIIPALLVSTGSTICAVPLSSIVESNKLEAGDVKTVRGREVTVFRGNVLPLLRLDEIFGWENGNKQNGNATYVVVVKFAGTQVGLTVDALLEQQELVVKSLDHFIGGNNGITGASILGDGRVVLILDVASLVRGSILERRAGKSNNEACLSPVSSAK